MSFKRRTGQSLSNSRSAKAAGRSLGTTGILRTWLGIRLQSASFPVRDTACQARSGVFFRFVLVATLIPLNSFRITPLMKHARLWLISALIVSLGLSLPAADTAPAAVDGPSRFEARASQIDPRVKAHPEIDFLIDDAKGRPADLEHASVDLRVPARGKLVIWLMGHNQELFDLLNSYGLHVIRPHYANRWFSICCRETPVDEHCRGNLRLEAATGEDFSDEVDIPKPDGMMERSFQFVRWLSETHPQGNWEQFLNADRTGIRWEDVIISGSSHGSTTAARFAKHVKVSRVVALCGPRDQHQIWQSLPSATPANRYFGFSHVLDGGWTGDHYCRSWELLGMNQFGAIVNVDQASPPYDNTRRLVTSFDVGGDANRAHSSVQPGRSAYKSADGKSYVHEPVWRYLYTHPVDSVGTATPLDDSCDKEQRQ